jgi:glyoxylase-like metal-dependent hydrolase (beta-lactamase superfamily II)
MPFHRVSFFNSGYCRQLGYLAGRRSWGPTRFYGVFVYLEHPEHGRALVDTGYAPEFWEATRSFPERLYRWATPANLDPLGDAAAILRRRGIEPETIDRIFVSHFHGDHIAGLRRFPGARFVYRRAAYEALLGVSTWRQVRQAFLAKLLPADFTARGLPIDEGLFAPGSGPLAEFRVVDYWGDGDLLLVDLPGHAVGHTGYLIRGPDGYVFYIVDASWDVEALLARRPISRLVRGVQHDYAAYAATQDRLRRLAAQVDYRLPACHCLQTQELVKD